MKKNYIKPIALVCDMNTDDLCMITESTTGIEERTGVYFDGNIRRYYDEDCDDEDFEDIW